jgi:S-formylglutathione hydrolase FrmB
MPITNNRISFSLWAGLLLASLYWATAVGAQQPIASDRHEWLVHEVQCAYEAGKTQVRVLVPEHLEKEKHYPVVYVLPVEAANEDRYGDGLLEIKRHDLHNKYSAIFVAPTFSHLPWYADHPTDPAIRQETYFVKVVLPLVEEHYPVRSDRGGRLLLGFSKSGWGALAMLLRHPDLFGKAAAWDAPLMKDRPNQFGMGEIFGTQENFEKYRLATLLTQRAADLQGECRLIVTGYGNFRDQHRQAHELMTKLGIVHEYRDGPVRKHDWHSGWVEEAVALLFAQGDHAGASTGGPSQKPAIEVYFSPGGGCTDAILRELAAAKTSVLVQAYSFTSAPIAEALVAAHQRGVKVEVIVDHEKVDEKHSQAGLVAKAGIRTLADSRHLVAHNKVIVVDGRVVLTGSFNFNRHAEEENAENLLVIRDEALAAKYTANWNAHAGHSEPCGR